jgi:hypothetical protein
MEYYKNTLSKMSKRSKAVKRKFLKLDLKVNDIPVNIKAFKMLEGVDFHFDFGGLILDNSFEFTVWWFEGVVVKEETLTGKAGYWYDGATIPKIFQKFIGKPLDPRFMLPSLAHDIACESRIDHWIESTVFYELLKYQKGRMDFNKWEERALYVSVYAWSVATS